MLLLIISVDDTLSIHIMHSISFSYTIAKVLLSHSLSEVSTGTSIQISFQTCRPARHSFFHSTCCNLHRSYEMSALMWVTVDPLLVRSDWLWRLQCANCPFTLRTIELEDNDRLSVESEVKSKLIMSLHNLLTSLSLFIELDMLNATPYTSSWCCCWLSQSMIRFLYT